MDKANRCLARRAQRLGRGLALAFVALAFIVVAERAGYAGLYRAAATHAAWREQLLLALPAVAYLAALWELRRGVVAVGAGRLFGPSLASALRRVGLLLVVGALTSLFVIPALYRFLGSAYPRSIDFDVATLVVAVLGLALAFVARLLQRAGVIEAELDEMF